MAIPRYSAIKQHLRRQIELGDLLPGAQVPSENALAQAFTVSRMTARRALTEMVEEGVLQRSRGRGTFVAETRAQSSMLAIRNLADEIQERGHHWRCDVLDLQTIHCDPSHAQALALEHGTRVAFSLLLHFENGLPVQLEERRVNLALAPDYLGQDFATTTPHAYLCRVAPLTEADHSVEAVAADAREASLLQVAVDSPCLQLNRRTFSQQGVVSVARLLHPGARFRLGAHLVL